MATFIDSLGGEFWVEREDRRDAKAGMHRGFARVWQQKLAGNSGWRDQVTWLFPQRWYHAPYPTPGQVLGHQRAARSRPSTSATIKAIATTGSAVPVGRCGIT